MSDLDNIFNGEEPKKSEDEEVVAADLTAEQASEENAAETEAFAEPTADEIADKYSAEPEQAVQPEEPQTPSQQPYYQPQPQQQQPYNQPQQPYYQQPYNQQQQPYYQQQYSRPAYTQQQPAAQPANGFAATAPKQRKKGRAVFCAILALIIIVAGISIPVSLYTSRNNSGIVAERETSTAKNGNSDAPGMIINDTPSGESTPTGAALTAAQIYKKISPSIVALMIYTNDTLYTEGTGIIMSVDATKTYTYILTCAHLLNKSGITAAVQFEDGTRYDAEIVGYDARTDVGIVRIKETGFTVAEFGDSDKLSVGDPIYAIGNPGGSEFFGTFTDGMVSSIGRSITSSIGYDMVCIQHNAAISPGNSGGALVNQYGQVIGINSSKIAATEYEGISFAIPITQAKSVIEKVSQYGYVPGRAQLGISYLANNSSQINSIYSMAVQMKGLPSGSLVIYSINADSDLRNTDAQAGDMIIAVDGKKLDKADVLLEAIDKASVGDEMTLTLFRISVSNGQYQTSQFDVKVKLTEETNKTGDEEQTTRTYQFNNSFGF